LNAIHHRCSRWLSLTPGIVGRRATPVPVAAESLDVASAGRSCHSSLAPPRHLHLIFA